jgi:hypothetical protein
MSSTPYPIGTIRQYSSSVPKEPVELFPDSIKAALDRIEAISNNAQQGEARPSADNIEWAKRVLLRVLPRHYLLGAEIDAFQHEIHVNWEHGNKRVTVFLPSPNQLKIYCEEAADQRVDHHLRLTANDPWEVSGVLRWLFA